MLQQTECAALETAFTIFLLRLLKSDVSKLNIYLFRFLVLMAIALRCTFNMHRGVFNRYET